MIVPNTSRDLLCHVVILETGLDKTSGTIYAYVRRDSDGYYLKADNSWASGVPTGANVPTATHVAQGIWKLTLSAAVTGALAVGEAVTCRMTDNETAASATVTSDVVEHLVDIPTLEARDTVESQRGHHTAQGRAVYVAPVTGNDTTGDGSRRKPYATITKALSVITTGTHATVFLLSDQGSGVTTLVETVTVNKRYVFIRGPGRDFLVRGASSNAPTFTVTAAGVELSGFQLESHATGAGAHGIDCSADFLNVHDVYVNATQGTGINLSNASNSRIERCTFQGTGVSAAGHGLVIACSGVGNSTYNRVEDCVFADVQGDAIRMTKAGSGVNDGNVIRRNVFDDSTAYGVNIGANVSHTSVLDNRFGTNASGNISDSGTGTHLGSEYTEGLAGTIGAALQAVPTAGAVSDAVWDEATADHVAAGTTGLQLTSSTAPSAAAIADAVWDESATAHQAADSTGAALSLALGLLQHNYVLDNTTYNSRGLLTAGRVRLFNSKADADAGTNAIATLTITGTAETAPDDNLGQSLKVTRDP